MQKIPILEVIQEILRAMDILRRLLKEDAALFPTQGSKDFENFQTKILEAVRFSCNGIKQQSIDAVIAQSFHQQLLLFLINYWRSGSIETFFLDYAKIVKVGFD